MGWSKQDQINQYINKGVMLQRNNMTNVFVKDDSGFDITFTVDDSSGEDVSLASISSVIL